MKKHPAPQSFAKQYKSLIDDLIKRKERTLFALQLTNADQTTIYRVRKAYKVFIEELKAI